MTEEQRKALQAARQRAAIEAARQRQAQMRTQASARPGETAMDMLRRTGPAEDGAQGGAAPGTPLDPVQRVERQPVITRDEAASALAGQQERARVAGTALNNAGESLTLGVVGDEAAAAFDEMVGRGSYEERLQFYRDNQQEIQESHPMLSFASEIAPALIPGMGGAKLVQALSSKLGRTGAAAALGALSGAIYGAAEGEGGLENRVDNAVNLGALGTLFGAAAPKVGDALSGIPARVSRVFGRAQERPTVQNLRAAKNVAYRAVDESGETFSGEDMQGLYQQVSDTFDAENYVAEVDDASRAVLRILERRQGQDTTLSQLDGIRQNLWTRYSRAQDQPQILDAIHAIDELIDSRAGASDLMAAARAANARFAKSQLLEDAFTKATDQTASTGSGGNILNKYRQAVTSIINNPRKARFFTDDEISLMRDFVRGSRSENVARLVGKLAPGGNGLMMALHIFGGIQSGGATIPLMGVGAGAKSFADRNAMRGAEQIQDVLSGFRGQPQPPQITRLGAGAATAAAPLADRTAPAARSVVNLPR